MSRILTKQEWIRRKRIKRAVMLLFIFVLFISIIGISVYLVRNLLSDGLSLNRNTTEVLSDNLLKGIEIKQSFLTPNEYSRPQKPLKKVAGIVIHYTANPGTSADNNRSYFEGLAETGATSVSSHFIIGMEGEIVQCIPMTEVAYASNNRNDDTISIECCHQDKTGEFTSDTYDSLVSLTAALCVEYNLKEEDVIRHYDVTGKPCPLYYVDHEDMWTAFKDDVMKKAAVLKVESK